MPEYPLIITLMRGTRKWVAEELPDGVRYVIREYEDGLELKRKRRTVSEKSLIEDFLHDALEDMICA